VTVPFTFDASRVVIERIAVGDCTYSGSGSISKIVLIVVDSIVASRGGCVDIVFALGFIDVEEDPLTENKSLKLFERFSYSLFLSKSQAM
jgi:hypothetical protein